MKTLPRLLNCAFQAVRQARMNYSPHCDIWKLAFSWQKRQATLFQSLVKQQYQFSARDQYRFKEETLSLYQSEDQVVLKTIALYLDQNLKKRKQLSRQCYHVKRHGGLKGSVRDTFAALKDYRFVFKTDIFHYYERIDHAVLEKILRDMQVDQSLIRLIIDSVSVSSTWGGLYYDHPRGIPKGQLFPVKLF